MPSLSGGYNLSHGRNFKCIPSVYYQKFQIIDHVYPTRSSQNNFVQPSIKYKQTKNAISTRGPSLWNTILKGNLKTLTSEALYKRNVKDLLLSLENAIHYF